MRIALVCTPHTDATLRLAAQMGVSDLVARYPPHVGRTLDDMVRQARDHGLALSIVEGYIPHDANPVVGGKIGVIEKAHPILYSKVRPATGAVVADILDDKILTSSGVGDFYVKEKPIRGPVD